ncbi:MAG: hypothetical protein ACYCWE_20835 [Eubacteriales bacterium]
MDINDIPKTDVQSRIINLSRELWRQRFFWNKSLIVNILCDFGNTAFITKRTLENLEHFAYEFAKYYGFSKSRIFESILKDYYFTTEKLLKAIKAKDEETAKTAGLEMYRNADEIASFLAGVNPYWSKEVWQELFYNNIELIENDAKFRITRLCTTDIIDDELVMKQIMKLSDYMAMGLIRHFNL